MSVLYVKLGLCNLIDLQENYHGITLRGFLQTGKWFSELILRSLGEPSVDQKIQFHKEP